MNTEIDYLYRDAGNNKLYFYFVVEGILTEEEKKMIRDHLIEGEYFIPSRVGMTTWITPGLN